jgi:hypothetical protein
MLVNSRHQRRSAPPMTQMGQAPDSHSHLTLQLYRLETELLEIQTVDAYHIKLLDTCVREHQGPSWSLSDQAEW